MKKKLLSGAGVIAILLIGYLIVRGNKSGNTSDIITHVKQGAFSVEIETTGDLEAKNSVKILGPAQLRDSDPERRHDRRRGGEER